jgi:hypothetical protein
MDVVELDEIVGGREDESRYVYRMEKEHSKSSSTCAYQTWGSRGTECACEFLGNDRIIVVSLCLLSSCEASLNHVKSIPFM